MNEVIITIYKSFEETFGPAVLVSPLLFLAVLMMFYSFSTFKLNAILIDNQTPNSRFSNYYMTVSDCVIFVLLFLLISSLSSAMIAVFTVSFVLFIKIVLKLILSQHINQSN